MQVALRILIQSVQALQTILKLYMFAGLRRPNVCIMDTSKRANALSQAPAMCGTFLVHGTQFLERWYPAWSN